MHIAGGAENRFVLDRPMAAAAAPMGLAGHGAAGLSSLLHEGLARAKDLASKLDIAVDRTEISSRESTVQTWETPLFYEGEWGGRARQNEANHDIFILFLQMKKVA